MKQLISQGQCSVRSRITQCQQNLLASALENVASTPERCTAVLKIADGRLRRRLELLFALVWAEELSAPLLMDKNFLPMLVRLNILESMRVLGESAWYSVGP